MLQCKADVKEWQYHESEMSEQPSSLHISVMPDEVVEYLALKPGGVYIDGTLGAGGHSERIAISLGEGGSVISLDRDAGAVRKAKERFQGTCVKPYQANYRDILTVLEQLNIETVDGMLLDLGLSSDQLADRERGFSFDADGLLDLRFDTTEGRPAWQWLEFLSEERIAQVIFEYGEERYSRRIARAIVKTRKKNQKPYVAAEFANLVRECVPQPPGKARIDAATRTFQALRIFVNDELGALGEFLKSAPEKLKPNGRLVILSFHSLEDRIVKNAMRECEILNVVTKKPIESSEEEMERNPRARSAKLRCAERK
ncbi:MAG: 16S rRNA (cytosine(1402)-N(4))-methyltransferase RsmH [Planctomycetaceae bacterium]|nr:16S rRNA (cytosine(1402)-N(4))-methyltransferase RsmH [Planctomycetaceae bacterium]